MSLFLLVMPLSAAVTPNDPNFFSQGLGFMKIPEAWSTNVGSPNIKIALLDTGVYPGHPDLVGNLLPGWNFVTNTSDTGDNVSHGTYMVGTISAATQNGEGGAGVCWNCKVIPLKITSTSGGIATDSAVTAALQHAQTNGARIVVFGYGVAITPAVASAVHQYMQAGGLVIARSGDDASTLTTADNPEILTVSAIDSLNTPYNWANVGPLVDLAAAGSTYNTAPGGGYANHWGTSYAAAYVAGAAALVMAANSKCTAQEISAILMQSADDLGPAGRDSTFGWGRLNAQRAVGMANTCALPAPAPDPVTNTTLTSRQNPAAYGQQIFFQATVSNPNAPGSVAFMDGSTVLGSAPVSGGLAGFTSVGLAAGIHSLTAAYSGSASYASSTSTVFSQTINKANTTVSFGSAPNPSTAGQQVTYAANVSPSSVSGNVTFTEGTQVLAVKPIVSGQASFFAALAPGTHVLKAQYDGNSNYNISSSTITQIVSGSATTSACDINADGLTNVLDVQQSVNQALGVSACIADLNKDGACNVLDVQRVTNAALGGMCVSG